ncbi:transcription termination/antitermination protein NusG [Kiritimatiella glycovorans]|uniref:Transcription termination/antitermination protein NusG n=1 Tax=Kiritimatiella glycovorans TaxID=1307763 RepID=A0A0G3EF55_9BACT|nr:transcription termination/antitermination protein NusG [Kiritimatiella glycovorans]AKJ64968.1 Transcription termination/antitermination protein NusG [Kiritimatiella glycovorans]
MSGTDGVEAGTGIMEKQWYVLHTLSGHEQKVRDNISSRVAQEEMEDYIGEVVIPTEKVSEVKQGKRRTTTRKFFPGYVLISVALYDENNRLDHRPWYFLQQTPGVIGFVGGEKPVPLRPDEVDMIFHQVEEKKQKVQPKVMFQAGETVKITDGPFVNFTGVIEEVDSDRGKLKVSVSIFGRTAPVELEFWQVERT